MLARVRITQSRRIKCCLYLGHWLFPIFCCLLIRTTEIPGDRECDLEIDPVVGKSEIVVFTVFCLFSLNVLIYNFIIFGFDHAVTTSQTRYEEFERVYNSKIQFIALPKSGCTLYSVVHYVP